jgi:hypothetical protein
MCTVVPVTALQPSDLARRWCAGRGAYIIVIYQQIDEDTIYPVTAYEVPEP